MGDDDRDDRALVGESMCVREKEGSRQGHLPFIIFIYKLYSSTPTTPLLTLHFSKSVDAVHVDEKRSERRSKA